MKSVIVFGAAIIGQKFLFENFNKVNIVGYFDNYKEGFLYKYPIMKPYYDKNYFIIVATNRYFEVRSQLQDIGYKEFDDFIPYSIFNKKMAIAYGNCHIDAIRAYLEMQEDFSKEIGFYPFPLIQNLNKFSLNVSDILSHCDIFFHQAIRIENVYGKEYASSNMICKLNDNCNIISVPNLYGMPKCFFPQYEMNTDKYNNITKESFAFLLGYEKNILNWINEGKSLDDVKDLILNGGVYNSETICMMWTDFKNKLLEREKQWDIKISDYIFENYKNKKLFYDPNHISDLLAREIAIRILKYLGYKDIHLELRASSLDCYESIVYADVKKTLGIKYEKNTLRSNCRDCTNKTYNISEEEYISDLYQWGLFLKEFD